MTRRILLTSKTSSHAPGQLERLRAAGFVLEERYDIVQSASRDDLVTALDGAWCVIAGAEVYDRQLFDRVGGVLRAIGRPGTGHDSIDLDAATAAGTVVFSTPGVNRHAVADFAVALMLGVLRRLPELDREVREGRWRAAPPGRDLHGATVGIVGLGDVGGTVARRLSGFDCTLLGCDPFVDEATARELGVRLMPFHELIGEVDVLTLHTGLSPATHHLLGAAELAAMKRGAVVINTSRGPIVDERALCAALEQGHLGGAGLDVFELEPLPRDHALTACDNVLLASHVASTTGRSLDAMVGAVVDGILALADGRLPRWTLNPTVLEVSAATPGGEVR